MSPFVTTLAVEVDRLKKLLPKGSHIEDITYDKATQELQMRWSNPQLVTPYTFPLPFTVEQLENQKLPQGATMRKPDPKPVKPVTRQAGGSVDRAPQFNAEAAGSSPAQPEPSKPKAPKAPKVPKVAKTVLP